MGSRAAFIVGAGVGYVLGTRAGRQRFETISTWSRKAWQSPVVQARVSELEDKAVDFARTEGAAIKGRVTENLRSTVKSAARRSGGSSPEAVERHALAPTGGAPAGGGASTGEGAPFTTGPGTSPAAGSSNGTTGDGAPSSGTGSV